MSSFSITHPTQTLQKELRANQFRVNHCCDSRAADLSATSDFHIFLSESSLPSCYSFTSTLGDFWSLEESFVGTCWLPNHSSKMTTNPSSEMHDDPLITMEQSIYSRPGSLGGNIDLFCAAEGVSTARRSCAAIAIAHESQIPLLPMFKRGIQMDVASAFRWHFTGRVPLGTTMAFWFMADDPTEERFRVWMRIYIVLQAKVTAKGP